jgi:hypothetical protein
MLRFRLRRLLIAVTVGCVVFAWCRYSLDWIEARRTALNGDNVAWFLGTHMPTIAPGGLWLFGEGGVAAIRIAPHSDEELERIASLFPESQIKAMTADEFSRLTLSTTRPRQILRAIEIGITH